MKGWGTSPNLSDLTRCSSSTVWLNSPNSILTDAERVIPPAGSGQSTLSCAIPNWRYGVMNFALHFKKRVFLRRRSLRKRKISGWLTKEKLRPHLTELLSWKRKKRIDRNWAIRSQEPQPSFFRKRNVSKNLIMR